VRAPAAIRRRELLAGVAVGALAATPGGQALAAKPRWRTHAAWEEVSSPADLGVLEAAAMLRSRRLSSVELTRACLARVDARNGGAPSFDGAPNAINAWARLYPELALRQARAADRRLARERHGRPPLLCGIPVALKDLYAVRGLPLTASSRVLENNVASESSAVWARLREAGMVLLGHTQTHEFGAGSTTDQVGNPWRLARSAGGSSGGSAAALAARMVPAATGTDTGGSLRLPAALCGLSVIKPTRGLVPTSGVIPVARSLDHAGPMARTVADCAALLQTMGSGAWLPRLATSPRAGRRPLAGLTVAVTKRSHAITLDADVVDGFDAAVKALARLGARVELRAAPASSALENSGYIPIFSTELWSYHRRFADRAELYRPEIARLVATSASEAGIGYAKARHARARVTAAWTRWFVDQRVDLLLEPTTPMPTAPRGAGYAAGYPELIAWSPLAAIWDVTGFPVVGLAAGIGSRSGSPVGVSLIAPPRGEAVAIRAAVDLQARALPAPIPADLDTRLGG
jgi:aspartyl-tRNA(Asn)/glutamyl-tRNA(Gln) amidotransferase subunit A